MKPALDRHNGYFTLEETSATSGLIGQAMVMTALGERAVATLQPGDRIITRDRGMAILEDIRARQVQTPLVKITARSLGHNRPEGDTLLPAGQRVLIRDWRAKAVFGSGHALVPAERLVDGEFITFEACTNTVLYDLLFEDPHILYVDGLELASYIDEHAFF
ncbi:MAG: Hint domain-containing protein [Pseudomonadota bacterium]